MNAEHLLMYKCGQS